MMIMLTLQKKKMVLLCLTATKKVLAESDIDNLLTFLPVRWFDVISSRSNPIPFCLLNAMRN